MTSCQPLRPHGPQFCPRCSDKRWYEYAKLLIFLHPTKRYAPFHYFKGGVIIPFEKGLKDNRLCLTLIMSRFMGLRQSTLMSK